MTIAAALEQARRYARVSSTQASDSQVQLLMQDAIDELANDVDGFPTEAYLSIAAKFDVPVNYAIRITIAGTGDTLAATDVLVSASALTGATGTAVATAFTTAINTATGGAGATVTWANFYFTVAVTSATSITFAAPTTTTYVDARNLLGLSGTTAAASVTGVFPQDCTMEATIPSTAFKIERVEWDGHPLYELPASYFMSPESQGDPQYYRVRGREIRLSPSPTRQESFHIEYRGAPAALSFGVDTNLPTEIPGTFQQAIPHLVASKLLEETQEKMSDKEYMKYLQLVNKYKSDYGNRNTQVLVGPRSGSRFPRVSI